MPNNKRLRTRRNRPRRYRPSRKVAQVSTGIPITRKRISGNPPVINEISAQTVKVTFDVNISITTNTAPFSVTIGSNPFKPNAVLLTATNSADVLPFYLTTKDIFSAAYIRLAGAIPTDQDVLQSTEMSVQTISFYGPLGTGSVRMGADFGPGMPGAVASDEGTASSRPAVRASSPRLYWHQYSSASDSDSVCGFWIYGFNPIGNHLGAGANLYTASGRVDVTVHVRRSWYSASQAYMSTARTPQVSHA